MIKSFPSLNETLVLSLEGDIVCERIRKAIEDNVFNGRLEGNRFRLTAHMIRPPQLQPVVRGLIERTSGGTVIFLRYEFLPSTMVSLMFLSLVMILGSIGLAVDRESMLYICIGLLADAVIWWIAWSNLSLHLQPVKSALHRVLS